MWETIYGMGDMLYDLVKMLIDVMGEEQFWGLLATGVASFWAWAQRKAGIERKEQTTLNKALSFLEAGVSQTYEGFVRARKKAAADGKLTDEERAEARRMAVETAKTYALENGLDLIQVLGGEALLSVTLEKVLGSLKQTASGPVKPNGTNGTH